MVAGQLHTPAVKIEETIKQISINNAQTNVPCIVPNQIDAQMIFLVLNFNKTIRATLTLLSTVYMQKELHVYHPYST